MDKRKTDIIHIFSTPIWTAIVPNYKEINIKMSSYIASLRSKNYKGKFLVMMMKNYKGKFLVMIKS